MNLLIDLHQEDIIKHPVWEFHIINGRENVRPSYKNEISDNDNTRYIVQTNFILNCKTELFGFCSPQDPSGIDYVQSVIFTPNGQMIFYSDKDWEVEQTVKEMNKLGLSRSEIFPIKFKSRIKCDGYFYSSVIIDFNQID